MNAKRVRRWIAQNAPGYTLVKADWLVERGELLEGLEAKLSFRTSQLEAALAALTECRVREADLMVDVAELRSTLEAVQGYRPGALS